MAIPKDPMILLSYLNTQLRDTYPSFEELCKTMNLDYMEIVDAMAALDYHYDESQNRFL